MIKLETSSSVWDGFAGAMRFPDGHEPLFCGMAFPAGCPLDTPEPWAMLVLDYQADGQKPDAHRDAVCLTINMISEEGYPATYERRFAAHLFSRKDVQEWAEKTLDEAMTHRSLLLAGFAFNTY